jgi:hypothetical protein
MDVLFSKKHWELSGWNCFPVCQLRRHGCVKPRKKLIEKWLSIGHNERVNSARNLLRYSHVDIFLATPSSLSLNIVCSCCLQCLLTFMEHDEEIFCFHDPQIIVLMLVCFLFLSLDEWRFRLKCEAT